MKVTTARVRKLKQQTEESMEPKDWAVLLADDLAACEDTFAYTARQTESDTPAEAAFFHPQTVFERMSEQPDAEDSYRRKAFEYRRAASLAVNINADIHRRMNEEALRIQIAFYHCQLLQALQCGHDGLLAEGVGVASLKEDISRASLERHGEIVEGRLPIVLALKNAVTTISDRHFRGHGFLTRWPKAELNNAINSWRVFTKLLNGFVPEGFRVDPNEVAPLETGSGRLVAAWEEEAEREARRLIYHDDGWPEFQEMMSRTAED